MLVDAFHRLVLMELLVTQQLIWDIHVLVHVRFSKSYLINLKKENIKITINKKAGYSGTQCLSFSSCTTNSCLNGGVCTSLSATTFSCSCATGYQGTNCQTCNYR
jgi:hypothetical protein